MVHTEFQCRAPEGAKCRMACARCWHSSEEGCVCEYADPPRQPDLADVECMIMPWLAEDVPEECYDGEEQAVRGPDWQPIDAVWDGDNYLWDYAN